MPSPYKSNGSSRRSRHGSVWASTRPLAWGNLTASSACQRLLADAGYPCPAPLDGPATTDGHTATIESLLERGEPGDAHEPATRKAMARSLLAQLEILRAVPAGALA